MKSRLSQWLFAIILFSFVSCNKELSLENGKEPVYGNFYATIDGKQWDADSLQLIFASNGGISINGLSKTGGQISMILPTFKIGTVTLNAHSESYAYYTNILVPTPVGYLSNAGTAGGTVTISAIDTVNHLVSGSFSFTLINPDDNTSKPVTQGIFYEVPYSGNAVVIIPPITGDNTVDTLTALIDGIPFVAARIESETNAVYPDKLLIGGSSEDGTQRIELIFPIDVVAGTYNLDYETGNYIGIYYPPVTETLVSQANGTLTILSNDTVKKRIIGTFIFEATPVVNGTAASITNGYFSVNY
jgi:Family of unknown function (DUF6252)